MTKAAALYSFFSQFGLAVFPDVSVPTGSDSPSFPYLTYEVMTGADMDKMVITASLWYRETEWTRINAKTDEISQAINRSLPVQCDDGGMIFRRGSPFAVSMGDPTDDLIKRKVLNIEVTFCTPY